MDGKSLTVLEPIPNTILMQFTGLKYKNGKEIYEADFIDVDYKDERIFEVCWVRDGWGLFRNDVNIFELGSPSMDVVEVIGNIYENPELLYQISETQVLHTTAYPK